MVRGDGEGCEAEPVPSKVCGRVEITPDFVVTGTRISRATFCKVLENMLFNFVVDQTGLGGVYDVRLDLSREGFNSGTDGLTATVLALRNQLGLKLERGKREDGCAGDRAGRAAFAELGCGNGIGEGNSEGLLPNVAGGKAGGGVIRSPCIPR